MTYYHTDHLGSSSWITYTDGIPVQYLSYMPFGESQMDQRSGDWNSRYTFSGKERDEETGYSYFGARYYDPDLSIWLSRDPLVDKYPNLSPYVYCANNPMILKDPDGRDYELVFDEKNKQVRVMATYYTSDENKKDLQASIDIWKGENGKYTYLNTENGQEYSVMFDLNIADGNFSSNEDAFSAANNDKSGYANYFETSSAGEGTKGATTDGYILQVDPNKDDKIRTGAHEIGHSLGVFEFDQGLMQPGGKGKKIDSRNIQNIFYNAGYVNYPKYESGQNNVNLDLTRLKHIGRPKTSSPTLQVLLDNLIFTKMKILFILTLLFMNIGNTFSQDFRSMAGESRKRFNWVEIPFVEANMCNRICNDYDVFIKGIVNIDKLILVNLEKEYNGSIEIHSIATKGDYLEEIIADQNEFESFLYTDSCYMLWNSSLSFIFENVEPYCTKEESDLLRKTYLNPLKLSLYSLEILDKKNVLGTGIYYNNVLTSRFLLVFVKYAIYEESIPLRSYDSPYIQNNSYYRIKDKEGLYIKILIPIVDN